MTAITADYYCSGCCAGRPASCSHSDVSFSTIQSMCSLATSQVTSDRKHFVLEIENFVPMTICSCRLSTTAYANADGQLDSLLCRLAYSMAKMMDDRALVS